MTGAVAGVLGLGWAVVVLDAGMRRWSPVRRPDAAGGPAAAGDAATRRAAVLAVPVAVGRTVRRCARRPADVAADRRVGWAVLAGLAVAVVAPVLAPLPLAWATAAPAVAARRATREREADVLDQLPDVVDLLVLTTVAGLPVGAAFGAIGARPGGPLGSALAAAAAHVAGGGTTAGGLAILAEAGGPTVRPLVDVLAEHDRYGTPLRPALERVAVEARVRRRRHAEEAARRLPVTLLFPLVSTIFPAFVLLTVVPIVAGSIGSLSP